jgi:uncharacterized protein GlcG (DUF336 family)
MGGFFGLGALTAAMVGATLLSSVAQSPPTCPVGQDNLAAALKRSVRASGGPTNGGFDTNEWAAVVDRHGTLCAIAFSGAAADEQWPGSRAIAAEKANTANALSLKGFASSSANLYAPTQPGGPLYGLALSNPPNQDALYGAPPEQLGTAGDPMLHKAPGGVIVFGGGLALYDGKNVIGGLGVSGDTSCADHNIAWRVRAALNLDLVPAGVNPTTRNDGIIYDIGPNGKSASGYGHPTCGGKEAEIATQLHAGGSAANPGQ